MEPDIYNTSFYELKRHICIYTGESHTNILCASSHLQIQRVLPGHTQERSHTSVMSATRLLHNHPFLGITSGHTQEKSHTYVKYVARLSHQHAVSGITSVYTQGKSHTNVLCATNPFVGQATSMSIAV